MKKKNNVFTMIGMVTLVIALMPAAALAQEVLAPDVVPGGLETAVKEAGIPYADITSLTVTGVLDDDDFAFIKDSLPHVTTLYLGGVSLTQTDIPHDWMNANALLTGVVLPSGSYNIGDRAFFESGLTGTLTLPAAVAHIGLAAFGDCTGLTAMDLSTFAGVIGHGAFGGCTGLTGTLAIPAASEIGDESFTGCSGITVVDLSTFTGDYIGNWAFADCSLLGTLRFGSMTAPALGVFPFVNVLPAGTIYYPEGADYSTVIEELPSGWKAIAAGTAVVTGAAGVWSASGRLYITATQSGTAQVYSLIGALVKTVSLAVGQTTVTPLPRGVYVVKTNGGASKVTVE